MRLAAGLEPPERRQGQAAHDFEMAIGGRQTLMAFARRRGTSPSLPSPLLQRLDAFIGATRASDLRERGQRWIDAAHRIDAVAEPEPARRPSPSPALALRPRQLSVTEIETLIRSPYDIYARRVLRLVPLQPLGEAPGARKLGELPPADLHLTVMRSIGGCALATIKTDGRTRLVPLGHSDRAVTPAGGTPRRR